MDEFSDTDSAYTAEAVPEAYEAGNDYADGAEEAGPPDVTEALQQMQATLDARLPALEEEEDHGEYGVQPGAGEEFSDEELLELADQYGLGEDVEELEDLDAEELEELIDERVNQALLPAMADIEWNRRTERLHQLATRYPELRDPQAIDEVSAEVKQIGAAYGIESADTDPALVELVLQARGARRVGNAELEAPEPEPGAVLETGVGPSPKTEEMDPETRAYMDVIHGEKSTNAFTA
jgi:hypothetical protein